MTDKPTIESRGKTGASQLDNKLHESAYIENWTDSFPKGPQKRSSLEASFGAPLAEYKLPKLFLSQATGSGDSVGSVNSERSSLRETARIAQPEVATGRSQLVAVDAAQAKNIFTAMVSSCHLLPRTFSKKVCSQCQTRHAQIGKNQKFSFQNDLAMSATSLAQKLIHAHLFRLLWITRPRAA